jgi:hypothetical protein
LPDALDQICRQLGCAYTIEQNGIVTLRPTPSNPPKKNDISRVSGPDSQVADLNAPFPPLYQDVVESELAQSIPGGGKMSFKGRDAAKVAEELTRLSVALSSPYKNGHGIQFVSGTNANPAAPNLEVIYDSLGNLLGQVCQQLNCTFTIEQNGVVMLRPNPAPTPRPSPK